MAYDKRSRAKEPLYFGNYMHDKRGPQGSIISFCCEGPECLICAADPAAARRANNPHFPHEEVVQARGDKPGAI